ncbi:GDNF family receptor alpha-1, partial [Anabarilius grahami]
EPALAKENNCLNAAKACNLNDTCKKYRSAYISPCTSRVSTAEVCNKRKCHKALRQFFDKVPPKHSYGMLFCSCPLGDQSACSERRRQTIVPACSYEDKERPNCLTLQASCKTNYICRSRLADFFTNCQPEPRSLSGCLKENYADCLLSYSGLIGTVMTPNYLRSPKISVSPFCDCTSSGNSKEECDRFTEFFTDNACLHSSKLFSKAFSCPPVSLFLPLPLKSPFHLPIIAEGFEGMLKESLREISVLRHPDSSGGSFPAPSVSGCLEGYDEALWPHTLHSPLSVMRLSALGTRHPQHRLEQSRASAEQIASSKTVRLLKGNAIQAFGNGTDVSVWQPMPPVQTTASMTTPSQRARDRDRSPNAIEPATHINQLNPADNSLYQFCGSLQDPQINDPSSSNAISRNSSTRQASLSGLSYLLLLLATSLYCIFTASML